MHTAWNFFTTDTTRTMFKDPTCARLEKRRNSSEPIGDRSPKPEFTLIASHPSSPVLCAGIIKNRRPNLAERTVAAHREHRHDETVKSRSLAFATQYRSLEICQRRRPSRKRKGISPPRSSSGKRAPSLQYLQEDLHRPTPQ